MTDTKYTVEDLAAQLKLLEELPESDIEKIAGRQYYKNHPDDENHPVSKAALLADEVLITDAGGCDWAAIHQLRHFGYAVYPGERDSFGWLTGCIEKNHRILVYG